jgi:hypothetical protein
MEARGPAERTRTEEMPWLSGLWLRREVDAFVEEECVVECIHIADGDVRCFFREMVMSEKESWATHEMK